MQARQGKHNFRFRGRQHQQHQEHQHQQHQQHPQHRTALPALMGETRRSGPYDCTTISTVVVLFWLREPLRVNRIWLTLSSYAARFELDMGKNDWYRSSVCSFVSPETSVFQFHCFLHHVLPSQTSIAAILHDLQHIRFFCAPRFLSGKGLHGTPQTRISFSTAADSTTCFDLLLIRAVLP